MYIVSNLKNINLSVHNKILLYYMAPPLSKYQLEILNTEFYLNLQFFGRDKLYNILRQKYPDKAISRRQISEWLSHQEINQLYHPSKGKPKSIKSSMTTPNTILAIDLVNMEKFEVRNFKYLLNCIDMGSRFVYSQAMKNKTDSEVLKAFKRYIHNLKLEQFVPTTEANS